MQEQTNQTGGATLTVHEVHEILGRDKISRAALYSGIQRGDIPSVRVSARRILVPRYAFEKWLERAGLRESA